MRGSSMRGRAPGAAGAWNKIVLFVVVYDCMEEGGDILSEFHTHRKV